MSADIDKEKSKWDQLPNEIFTDIFKDVGLKKLYPGLFVNHQWLTIGFTRVQESNAGYACQFTIFTRSMGQENHSTTTQGT